MSAEKHLRQVLVSRAAEGRLAAARSWLSAQGAGRPVLIVAATRHAADEMGREVSLSLGSSFGWTRTTLVQVAHEIALPQLAREGRTPLTPLGCEAVVARVVHDMRGVGGREAGPTLGVYRGVADGPGLARALSATLAEVRWAGIDSVQLATVNPDLAAIASRYSDELARGRFADPADIFNVAISQIVAEEVAYPWLDSSLLLLDVRPHRWLESELVRVLTARAGDLLCTAPEADPVTSEILVPMVGVTASSVERKGPSSSLQRLQIHLFEQDNPPQRDTDGSVLILSAPGEGRECVEVARHLCELASGGMPFDRVAIALRSADGYRAHLEEALGRADIPAYFSDRVRRPHVSGRALIALLDCCIEGLSAQRFAEYLSLDQVPDSVPPLDGSAASPEARRASGRSSRRWQYFLTRAAVIGGLERWRERLASMHGHLNVRLNAIEDVQDPLRERLRDDLAALEDVRCFALPILEQLDQWAPASWGVWIERLKSLAVQALREPKSVAELLDELAPMSSIGPVDLGEVRSVLADRLLALVAPSSGGPSGRVFVAPIEEIRGLSFEVVFVPGMAERLFPQKIAEDPILLDQARDRLAAGLQTNDGRLREERLMLCAAVGAAERQVVFSYPRLDLVQGRPRVPSFYALEAMRAAEGRLPTFDDLAARAERESGARIGWPAPTAAAQAIDEAEYDLALLDSLRSRDDDKKVGAARFLLSANPHLGRALRFRARRWLTGWTTADGLVRPSVAAAEVMALHRPTARSYSPTALEKMAVCPYRFFLYAVHRLSPREEVDFVDDLDPLQRGSLVHSTQCELFRTLRDEKMLPLRADNLENARAILDRCLDRQAQLLRDELMPRIERVWTDAVQSIRADLREWLRRLSEEEREFVPWRFELAFGLSPREEYDEESVAEALMLECGIQLRGSIDLVERRDEGTLRATDHKTGAVRMPARAIIDGGKALQPVLYALALEKMYPDATVEGGRLYYCTSKGAFERREIALDARARQSVAQVARVVTEALETPFLPALPERGACQWCEYRVVCGPYEEQRTGRKKRQGVESFEFLRSLN